MKKEKSDLVVDGDVGQVVMASSVVYHAGSGPGQVSNAINMAGSVERANAGTEPGSKPSAKCHKCAAVAQRFRRIKLAVALAAAAACGALVATVRSHFAECEPAQAVASQCHFDGRQYSAGSIVKMSDGLARECLESVGGRAHRWSEFALRPI